MSNSIIEKNTFYFNNTRPLFETKIINNRLGVDRVKPWILVRMDLGWAGLDWRGPDISSGLGT